jgi:hypothetical protein
LIFISYVYLRVAISLNIEPAPDRVRTQKPAQDHWKWQMDLQVLFISF